MEATGDLIRKFKNFSKNNLETNEEEILREKYISPTLAKNILRNYDYRKNNFNNLRLI